MEKLTTTPRDAMTIGAAVRILGYTKFDMMLICFGRSFSGIDGAIPQGYVNARPGMDLFWHVTDCRGSMYEVKDMREIMPHAAFMAIMGKAIAYEDYNEGRITADQARLDYDSYDATIKNIIDMMTRSGRYAMDASPQAAV